MKRRIMVTPMLSVEVTIQAIWSRFGSGAAVDRAAGLLEPFRLTSLKWTMAGNNGKTAVPAPSVEET
ncbi:MAG: hypothetical protein ACREC2_10270, partial [Bradyrhizobium sp.]